MQVDELPTVGVVGLSEAGRRYASVARDLGCEVVGADASEKARRQFEDSVAAETFEDFEAMYGEEVGAVVVSTPNRYHEATAVPALAAGLDVFFEKPLAHDYESAQRIVDAAEASDSVCMVGYYNTLYECVQAVRSYIDDGHFGDISHVQATWVFRRAVPRRGSWYTSRELAGGGVLQDKGSFLLNVLSYFGFPLTEIESVAGKARSEFGGRDDYTSLEMWGGEGHENIFDVEDSLSAFVQFEDGKTAAIETAWAANMESRVTFEIRGVDGGAHLNLETGELTLFGVNRNSPESLTTTVVEPNYGKGLFAGREDPSTEVLRKRAFRRFLECRDRGEQPDHTDLRAALDVQRAIRDVYAGVDDSTA
jgi:predicted dehydrogenase